MSLFPPASCPRLIVKIGSALLVDPDGAVRRDWLTGIAADIAERARAGQQVAVVSSGAIALGARRLGLPKAAARAWRMRRPPPRPGRSRSARCGPRCWAPKG